MADFGAVTASSGAKVTDIEAVRQLLKKYDIEGLEYKVTNDGYFYVYGYEYFSVYTEENGYATEEFLEELSTYLDEILVIQSIGGEKCRFPLSATEIIITPAHLLKEGNSTVEWNSFKN